MVDILGKIAKNFMKITKSIFLGQNSGRGTGGGGKPILWVVGVFPVSPTGETLLSVIFIASMPLKKYITSNHNIVEVLFK